MGVAQVIVLDTHVWVWWVSNPESLSLNARNVIDRGMTERTLFISSISAWEVAMLAARKRLVLTMDVRDWIAKSEALPFLHFVPVSNSIAVKSVQLPGPLHSDPADRIIIATATEMGAPVATMDEKIRSYQHVKSIW